MSDNIGKQLKEETEGSIEYRCLNALMKDYMLKVDVLEDILNDIDMGVMKLKTVEHPNIKVSQEVSNAAPKLSDSIKEFENEKVEEVKKLSENVGRGKVCTFKGYDFKDLYGYNLSDDRYKELTVKVRGMLVELIERKGVTDFITGGSLGFDKIVYFVVDSLKKKYPNIKNHLAIPFENQSSKWFSDDLNDYEYMKNKADSIVYVDTIEGYNTTGGAVGYFNPKKLKVCHEYMIDKSDYLIALYRGDDKGGVSYCINYGKSKKKEGVYTINPDLL